MFIRSVERKAINKPSIPHKFVLHATRVRLLPVHLCNICITQQLARYCRTCGWDLAQTSRAKDGNAYH